jgi:hypothetical protein
MSIPNNMPSNRTFGVEIEFVGIQCSAAVRALVADGLMAANENTRHNDSSTNWRIVLDSSVIHPNGAGECVSPILRGVEGLAQVAKVLNALRRAGATVNSTCGIHVHFGARDLTAAECAAIFFAYGANEVHFDSVVQRSRRNSANQFCRSGFAGNEPNSFFESAASNVRGNRISSEFWRNGRYNKVNLRALTDHGTIEFRQHGGSLDASKVCNWIVALLGFFEHTVNNFRLKAQDVVFPTAPVVSCSFGSYVRCSSKQRRIYDRFKANRGTYYSASDLATLFRLEEATVSSYMSVIKRLAARDGWCVVRRRNLTTTNYEFAVVSPSEVPAPSARSNTAQRSGGTLANLLKATASEQMTFEALFGLAGQDVLSYFLERATELRN